MNKIKFGCYLMCFVVTCMVFAGCSGSGKEKPEEYLIKSGDKVITVFEYYKALEIAKSAYPHTILQNPDAYNKIKYRLLNQMTEEMIIMKAAEALGIAVTDEELKNAVDNIKKDFPDNEFEQTLLENAISYATWEARLRTRLLMEKVVGQELESKIPISPEDVAKYYKENYSDAGTKSTLDDEGRDINKLLIKHLRMNKAQEAYEDWIKRIKQDFTIEINEEQWKKILEP